MWAFLAVCAAWYVRENLIEQLPGIGPAPSDFTNYYEAARHVAAGKSPYSDSSYDYPPAVAFALSPLALTNYVTARRIWFAASQIFLLLAAWITWRGVRPFARDRLAACGVAGVWAFGGAAAESLGLGQLSPLLVLLLAVAYFNREINQGLAAGVGASLKFIPGLLGIVPVLRRDWRGVAAFICALIAGIAIPSAVIAHWNPRQASPARADYWMGTPALLSWSMPSVVLRAMDPVTRGPKLPHDWEFGNGTDGVQLTQGRKLLSAAVAVAILLAGIALLAARCRTRLRAEDIPWASAALISLSVAASPISWTHYQVLQYPGLAMLVCFAAASRKWLLMGASIGLGALLYTVPVGMLRAYFDRYGAWTAWSPATLYIWTSITPVASLVLSVILLAQIRPQSPKLPKR
jgi:hypothetical protein